MQSSSDYILASSREYSIYVCEFRAIPRVCDGLKAGQRKALWLLRNRSDKIKTFSLAGLMGFEKIYVHGETSANDTISLLAAPFCNNVPLITGEGQFGTRIAPVEGIGAPRYTEVRRSKAAEHLLYRDLDLVPLRDNYDHSTQEPQHFLPLVPLVLLNGVSGVAVGWSTDILPRKLKHLISATQQALDGKPPTDLAPHFDYLNVAVAAIGPSQWEFSGRLEFLDTSTVRITELPPELNIVAFRERLNHMEATELIQSYVDRSTESIDITVRLKRGAVRTWTVAQAIDFFKLRTRITERIVVVDWDGTAMRQYETPEQLVIDFTQWRLGWYKKRYEKLLADASHELRFWLALRECFDRKFPARLNGHDNRTAVEADVRAITTKIELDDQQMDRIVGLPSYRWAKDHYATVLATIAELNASIAEFTRTLKSPKALKNVYHTELDALKSLRF